MAKPLFVCGYPGEIGGANTELWHTVRLWREAGWPVWLIPTWKADPRWRRQLEEIGCTTWECTAEELPRVPGLPGSVVVSMCNSRFLASAERFRRLGCRIVWLGCMNWLFPEERLHYRRFGVFDRHVFQSRYQRDQLVPQLRRFGYRQQQGRILRGALDLREFPFRPLPHEPGRVFVIGRLSRAAADKFSPRTWKIYNRVPHPVHVRVLGWSEEVEARLGAPPPWATCLPPGQHSGLEFLRTLHAVVHVGGQAVENWPRVGLEAMAAGVPVITDRRGGWSEMIRPGQTGYLCDSDDQFAYYTARLAYDEAHRLDMAHKARTAVETELAHAEVILAGWQSLLAELS